MHFKKVLHFLFIFLLHDKKNIIKKANVKEAKN